jgi:hypothetical protein
MAEIQAGMQDSFKHLTLNGIKKSVLDEFECFISARGTLSRPSLIIRCQIVDHDYDVRIVVDKPLSRWRVDMCFVPFLRRILPRCRGRSDFFLLVSDLLFVSEDKQSKCFDYFKKVPFLRSDNADIDPGSLYSILIPDFRLQQETYAEELIAIARAVQANPFERRQETIRWRGALNGPEWANLENYRAFHRYKLVSLSIKYPDILDARLTGYNVSDDESGAALKKRLDEEFGCPVERLPATSFVPYKYLVAVDGVTAPWKRVPTILASGSVLLLQYQWVQHFYAGLKPWVHYVPIKDDLSDLLHQYHWLVAHPLQAKKIAQEGLRFAMEILDPLTLETYFADVINKCGELYQV